MLTYFWISSYAFCSILFKLLEGRAAEAEHIRASFFFDVGFFVRRQVSRIVLVFHDTCCVPFCVVPQYSI